MTDTLNSVQFAAHVPGVRHFDVDYVHNHKSLQEGRTVDNTHRVSTWGNNDADASLLALQMVSARGKIPTALRMVL